MPRPNNASNHQLAALAGDGEAETGPIKITRKKTLLAGLDWTGWMIGFAFIGYVLTYCMGRRLASGVEPEQKPCRAMMMIDGGEVRRTSASVGG
jgi:hypothetical protein